MVPVVSRGQNIRLQLLRPLRACGGVSAPAFGDHQAYQMDPANAREALREAALDVKEGAVSSWSSRLSPTWTSLRSWPPASSISPSAAYQVSKRIRHDKAAAANGRWTKRGDAGVAPVHQTGEPEDLILTYFAKQAAALLADNGCLGRGVRPRPRPLSQTTTRNPNMRVTSQKWAED